MKTNETDQHPWNHEDVQRKESGKRGTGNNRSTKHQFHDYWACNGHATGDRSSDTQAPVSVLIEAKHLSAESHPKRHQQKEHADDPRKLTRKFVGPEQKHL